MNAPELWLKACEHLKSVLNTDVYARWIEIIKPVAIQDNRFILNVDNDFCQTWLEDNYKDFIIDALRSAGASKELEVHFVVKTSDSSTENPPAELSLGETEQKAPPVKRRHRMSTVSHNNPSIQVLRLKTLFRVLQIVLPMPPH